MITSIAGPPSKAVAAAAMDWGRPIPSHIGPAAVARVRKQAASAVANGKAAPEWLRAAAFTADCATRIADWAVGAQLLGPPARLPEAVNSRTTLLPLRAGSKWHMVAAHIAEEVEAEVGGIAVDNVASPQVQAQHIIEIEQAREVVRTLVGAANAEMLAVDVG